ncbi:NADPH-dependent FMN reductase [uncultured Algimonas sp.]|uniref:NADPH-dependent FMN reductase n=1 Tax=uncultured Algimonas sp. TaxID=1547920 RepID=UPI002622B687|nr:NADPH-dependent FMN reductase [uncultured Algimonas sp.]
MTDFTPKLAFVCGSLRDGSINRKLEVALMHRVASHGGTAEAVSLSDYDMPIYHGDLETPATVPALIDTLAGYDGIVIVTPEYNGSLPPVLKNAVDWTSTVSTRWIKDQTFGIASCTPGPMSGIMCLRELAFLLRRLGGDVVPTQVGVGNAANAFDGDGRLSAQPSSDFADQMLSSVIGMARRKHAAPDSDGGEPDGGEEE